MQALAVPLTRVARDAATVTVVVEESKKGLPGRSQRAIGHLGARLPRGPQSRGFVTRGTVLGKIAVPERCLPW